LLRVERNVPNCRTSHLADGVSVKLPRGSRQLRPLWRRPGQPMPRPRPAH